MGRAYSVDLRERVLRAHETVEGSQRVLAARCGVATSTVGLWLTAARDEGRRGPCPHEGGHKALGGADPAVLAALVAEAGDLFLSEYAARLAGHTGVRPSAPAMCRALARLGLPRKKSRSGRASRSARTS